MQNLNVKEPWTSEIVIIDATDVSKTKPRFFRYFFQKNLSYKKCNEHHIKVVLKSLNYIIYQNWNTYSV